MTSVAGIYFDFKRLQFLARDVMIWYLEIEVILLLVQLGVNYHNDRVKTGVLIDAYLLYTTCRWGLCSDCFGLLRHPTPIAMHPETMPKPCPRTRETMSKLCPNHVPLCACPHWCHWSDTYKIGLERAMLQGLGLRLDPPSIDWLID